VTTPAEPTAPQNPPAAAQNTDPPAQPAPEPTIPKSRFDEVNNKAKAAEAELERIKAEQAAAVEQQAKDQGKFKELAEQHTTTIAELKPKLKAAEERAERYANVLTEHVKGLRKDVPDYVLPLLDKLEPDEQLDYITKNGDKWAPQANGNTASPPRGAGPGPRAAGSPGRDDVVKAEIAQLRESGKYPRF
jgi:hypothetical protein